MTDFTVLVSQSSKSSLVSSSRMNLFSMILEAAVLKPLMDLALMVVSLTIRHPLSASYTYRKYIEKRWYSANGNMTSTANQSKMTWLVRKCCDGNYFVTWVILRTTFDLRIIFLLICPAPMMAIYLQLQIIS